ncbi:rho GTPase-activating protein 20-like isoform X3 [Mytilus edulis]|uniref:rho GTPase-activating protein 20-like isoform X3 n=1 Tax=Mytilus edulis TaxID=6550 RepID=UPI0039EE562D
MAYRLYASSESLGVVDSPTLSTRSLPGVYKKRYLQLSDEDSLCSSYECLNDINVSGNRRLRQISTSDSQDLSDMSPMSASGDSPRLPNTSVNYGKKRRAPLPPVHVSIKEPEHSNRQTQDDFYLERRLSRIEEDIEKRRRPISSYDAPLINVHSPEDISPRLSSSQRFRMKAAMILSLHSPKLNRRDTQGSKRKGKKKLLNQSFEELDPEDVVFCYLSPDLHEEYDFEVQRIPEYDKYLNDLLDETDPNHQDYEELSRATSRVQNMVKEHEDELGTSENQTKMDSIQLRFPNDNLQLDDNQQKRTSSTKRRKSAPGAILLKSIGKSKSSSNLWAGASMGKKETDLASPASRLPNQENRQFVMEGQVQFATGVQIQDRYMFLFNDLLLVAKQKTSTTFKLKQRVRVCEIWLSECINDVTELTRSTELSFVMGWPLCNCVATFKTLDLKQQWLTKLTEQIENERLKEQPRVIKLKVVSREISEPCTVDVDTNMDAQKVLKECMAHSHLSDSDPKDYQMWVRYGKEDSPYPLIGHELPYSIKMSQLRDSYQSKNGDVSLPSNGEILDLNSAGSNVEYILKHRKSTKKTNLDENSSGKSMKKPRRSPFSIFRRGKDDKNNNSSPTGKLFGRPIDDLVIDGGLPKAVMCLLRIMYRDGPYTKGILRKSANSVKCKEIHDKLDEGEECLDDNIQTLVVGAVLKDYLRNLPRCLLLEDHYNEWVALSEQDDSSAKMNKVKQLLFKLPPSHFDLLRHLICVLHHVQEKHSENMMTSYNLAVCITPSILWSKEQIKDPMATQSPHKAIMYLIDNCGSIFGLETLSLFGDEQKIRQDSSTDSDSVHSYLSTQDSGSGMRPDNSSMDSLEHDLYGEFDSSPNLVKSHLSPSNLSRDSGLTLSDAQLYDDDGSMENLTDRKNYNRSISQYMDRDSDKSKHSENVSRSYETYENPKPPPRKHKKREYSIEKDQVTKGVKNTMHQSYSAEGYQKYKRASAESLQSLEDHDNQRVTPYEFLRQSDYGTLIKSSSGAHLFLDENNRESSNNNLRYVSEIEIQTQRSPQGGNGKLTRQASVTESNPPMSPTSRLSCGSSFDSGIPHSLSCSSFIQGQMSHESDSHYSECSSSSDRLRQSQDDNSLNSQYSSARRTSPSKKYVNSLISPPISPKNSRKVFNSNSKESVSVRRSFPLELSNPTKGSGSHSYKEAEDIIKPRFELSTYEFNEHKENDHLSPILQTKYGSSASANDVRQNLPLKAFTKYGLGTSPPPGVVLKLHQKQQKRDNTPMRASHDSAIISQVRRNSTDSSGSDQKREHEFHHSELNIGKLSTPPYPLVKSDSDSDINRTLSNSPNRPDRPPSYDEACQRTFMLKHGIPLEISEQDSQKQKEASLLAKQLYEESLRKYMEEHLNSPSVQNIDRKEISRKEEVIIEQEEGESDSSEGKEEETTLMKKDPKKIWEESMKAYEQIKSSSLDTSSAKKSLIPDSSLLSPVALHRSASDSSDKAGTLSRRSPTREKSPLATDRRIHEVSRNSSPNAQLNYSSSSVSNSSSDTVTESQQIPPYRRDRSDSSPVVSRHYFPKASDNFAQNRSAQTQQRSSTEQIQSRESSVETRYSYKSRDFSRSQDRSNLYSRDVEQKETSVIRDSAKPRFFTGARESSKSQEQSPSKIAGANVTTKVESKNSIQWKSKREPVTTPKRDSSADLPWSVKNLRSVFVNSNSSGQSSVSSSSESRPPPPPYQPPPPFRRDNARMSSSSNSSCSSSNTDNSANIPQTKSSLSHRRLGGPQAHDSFSDDSDTSSRSSGLRRNSTNNSSDQESWTYLDTEVTFV